uniref:C2H2-type domain-containing protein n=1 Tax=viral metagenome TaxID=1070528 RepID=A0A6C0HY33_9ZZZZ
MIEYKCTECNIEFKTNSGLWKHNKNKHLKEKINKPIFKCEYCKKILSDRHSLWRHENKSCKKNTELINKITNINIHENNNSNINVIQNQTNINNITITFNSLKNQNVLELNEKQKEEIINDGLNGIITLTKHLNFNKDLPQNHLFCMTNINNKYVNALNLETNKIEKYRKFDFFEEVFKNSLKHMKILNNTIKDFDIQDRFEKKIEEIEQNIFNYIKPYYMKLYHDNLNMLSYNQRDIVRKTWEENLYNNNALIE